MNIYERVKAQVLKEQEEQIKQAKHERMLKGMFASVLVKQLQDEGLEVLFDDDEDDMEVEIRINLFEGFITRVVVLHTDKTKKNMIKYCGINDVVHVVDPLSSLVTWIELDIKNLISYGHAKEN